MSADYKGYKLLDRITLVCRDFASLKENYDPEQDSVYQAYLVDPASKNQLETARNWATWTEWSQGVKNEEGKWIREFIKHKPKEFEFDNNGFTLELLDCAGGSSQGGKLSFWSCLVRKEDHTFKIGINSEMLLDLLKNSTFSNGVCQGSLLFITQKGRVGMTVEGSETWQQCIKDRELKKNMKSNMTSKYSFGDIVKTPTITEVYLGTIKQYYTFDSGNNDVRYGVVNYSECTITKLAKPIVRHVFETVYKSKNLLALVNEYGASPYAYPEFKKNCPKRAIDGKVEFDCTEKDYQEKIMSAIYDYDAYTTYEHDSWFGGNPSKTLYNFLSQHIFGFGFEPFELDSKLMGKIKAAGIKYVEEQLNEV